MNVWLNKNNGEIALATPWWEPIKVDFDESLIRDITPELMNALGNRKIVKGLLFQAGWLIQNEHDVWFGFPLHVAEQFEDLGEV